MKYNVLVLGLLSALFATAFARVVPTAPLTVPLALRIMPCQPQTGSSQLDEHPQFRINSDNSGRTQNEEQACISPVNPASMVAVWRDFRLGYRRVGVGYSTDTGVSWQDTLFPQMYYLWQSDPTLTVDADGVFTANVITFMPDQSVSGLLQISSYDGGRTWQDSVWAAHYPELGGFEDKQMIAVDVSGSPYHGTYYCSWTHFYPGMDSTRIWLTFKRPGQPYSTQRLVDATGTVQWSNVCVGAEGEVYMTWVHYVFESPFWRGDLQFARSTDGGDTWLAPSRVRRNRFASAEINPDLLIFSYGVMACDYSMGPHRNRLYMVFTDADAELIETDVWLIYSDDHGATWSTPVRLDDEQVSTPCDQFHPWISVDEVGRVWVVFYDRRHDPNNRLMDVYFTVSEDGGVTWRPNERITTVSSDPDPGLMTAGLIGEYIGWQARGGKALCVWTDTRLGNQDAFAAVIDSIFTDDAVPASRAFAPTAITLHPAYPNPFNGSVTIPFEIEREQEGLYITIVNALGQTVWSEQLAALGPGTHYITWNGQTRGRFPAASGIYLVTLQHANQAQRQKVLLIR